MRAPPSSQLARMRLCVEPGLVAAASLRRLIPIVARRFDT
jgi:hypothetical protein